MSKRVFLIVLDSFGIGEAPDAASFGDAGANTLRGVASSGILNLPALTKLGFGNIEGVEVIDRITQPLASFGKMREISVGKDTTTGHWEIAGIVSKQSFPTYPQGFPAEIIDAFQNATGRGVLCNKPYSGTEVILDYGEEHLRTHDLIVYTSADSVFQIAAHTDIVPVEELYRYCKIAREILKGDHAVGRVIARPFAGEYPNFYRTADRRDFSLEPTGVTVLDAMLASGYDVISVGKIFDIFAGRGIRESHLSHGNEEGCKITSTIAEKDFNGLCFVNLVDFDTLYGHRNDCVGYAKALNEFDVWLEGFIKKLRADDIMIITADHGCDPSDISTDHTREYVPVLLYSKDLPSCNLGVRNGFCDVAATIAKMFDLQYPCAGVSLL